MKVKSYFGHGSDGSKYEHRATNIFHFVLTMSSTIQLFVCIRANIRHAKNSQRKYILLTVHINLNRATSTSMLIPKRRALANIHSKEGRQLTVLEVFGTSNHDRRNT